MKSTINSDSVAQDQVRSFFSRWERLEERKSEVGDDLKELFAEAKAFGFDTKVLRAVFRDSLRDYAEQLEQQAIYDLYAAALGTGNANARDTRDEDDQTVDLEQDEFEPAAPATTPPGAIAADLSDEGTNSAQPEPLSSDAQSPVLDPASGTDEGGPPSLAGVEGDADRQPISEPDKSARPSGDGLAAPLAFKPYDGPRDIKGLARPHGCLDLECCHSSTWRERCHGCAQAFAVKAGGTPIPHQGEVA